MKYLVLGDVHLLHAHNNTSFILNNLNILFNDFKPGPLTDLDAVFFEGDLFDKATDASNPELNEIKFWFLRLFSYCAKYKIILRILEGTPRHDQKQARIFETIASMVEGLDYRWVNTLEIEFLKSLNSHILYVPDEYRSNNRQTFEEAKQLMAEKNLNKVDLTIMHGMFGFQVNYPVKSDFLHFEQDYLGITKHYVHVGHIHNPMFYDRILGAGSFDRLAHNENHKKGCLLCEIHDNPQDDTYEFVVNKEARSFVTFRVKKDEGQSESLRRLDEFVLSLRPYSFVQIDAPKDHGLISNFSKLCLKYPQITFAKKEHKQTPKPNQTLVAHVELNLREFTASNALEIICALPEIKAMSDADQIELISDINSLING